MFELTAAATLDGTELMHIVQGGNSRKSTTSDVARTNLGNGIIASATTTDLGSVAANFLDVTSTNTITGFGSAAAGVEKTVRFTGVLTLTHNATSLILYSKTNITTYNGLVMRFRSLGSGNWIEISQTAAVADFTPTPNFGGGTTGITGTFTGRYTRLGNMVTVTAYMVFSNKGSSTGEFAFGGFAPIAKSAPSRWPGAVSADTNFSSLVAGVGALVIGGQNAIRLRAPVTNGSTPLTDVNFTNTTQFAVSVIFECEP
jgi:hypothetical protein